MQGRVACDSVSGKCPRLMRPWRPPSPRTRGWGTRSRGGPAQNKRGPQIGRIPGSQLPLRGKHGKRVSQPTIGGRCRPGLAPKSRARTLRSGKARAPSRWLGRAGIFCRPDPGLTPGLYYSAPAGSRFWRRTARFFQRVATPRVRPKCGRERFGCAQGRLRAIGPAKGANHRAGLGMNGVAVIALK